MTKDKLWLAFALVLTVASGPIGHAQEDAAVNRRAIPLLMSASNVVQQGFVRVINHSAEAGEVRIHAIDDAGVRYGPAVLSMNGNARTHFNSGDLESGNPNKRLVGGTGAGQGDWRLEMETALDIEALAYVRTSDGFVTSIHDLVAREGLCWRAPIFNPGSNNNQKSLLRVINPGSGERRVEIAGRDDAGEAPGTAVSLSLAGGTARTLSAAELESGGEGLSGALGDGTGKWELAVTADGPIQVMSLLDSTRTGNLANLSRPAGHGTGRCWTADPLAGADRSIVKYLTGPVEEGKSPGLIAAIIDADGVRAIASAGVRRDGSPQSLTERDLIHIGSCTKAMTSAMLATLIADGTFADGWETTIADVFPELLDEIHVDYHAVTLWQLVSHASGLAANAADWRAHRELPVTDGRYTLLRENLANAPAGSAGEFLYSNLGYMVAGVMAERRTGKSWEVLMEERLFAPLGMASAGYGWPGTEGEVDQPWGHRSEAGQWVAYQIDNAAALGPAGTVHVSIADWATFAQLWFNGQTPQILGRERLSELITPRAGNYAAGWITAEHPWANGKAVSHSGSNNFGTPSFGWRRTPDGPTLRRRIRCCPARTRPSTCWMESSAI